VHRRERDGNKKKNLHLSYVKTERKKKGDKNPDNVKTNKKDIRGSSSSQQHFTLQTHIAKQQPLFFIFALAFCFAPRL
jgi:hypothetical protein